MMNQGADAFLGTQGYVWDTQSDMLMALIGAVVAQGVLGKMQDKQLGVSCVDTVFNVKRFLDNRAGKVFGF